MFRDLRHAARVLLKNKAWTTTVVVSLALGIGANIVVFSALNGALLQKLSVDNPEALVRFRYGGSNEMSTNRNDYGNSGNEGGLELRSTFSYFVYQALRANNQTLVDLFACAPLNSVNAVIDGQAEIATAFVASGNYHGILGVKAVLGRTITIDDDQAGVPPVAVISSGYWKRRFGSKPDAIGKVVRINNVAVTIVGVIQPEFSGVQLAVANAPDISLPLSLDPQITADERLYKPGYWWLQVMGRLQPGATISQAQGNFQGVFQQAARSGMDVHIASLDTEERARLGDRTRIPQLALSSGARGVYEVQSENLQTVNILTVVVVLLLLIVCANVTNLLLSTVAARVRELSVRLALGATRRRLIRQLLTENILLAAAGGAAGLLVALWSRELLPAQIAKSAHDWRVLLFATSLTLFTGMIFGLIPALRATGKHPSIGLKEGGRGVAGARTPLSKSLVVIQIAVSFALLIVAGLFLRTVDNLRRVNVGFNPQNVILVRLNPRLNGYDQAKSNSIYQQLSDRFAVLPGVSAVSFSSISLLSGSDNDTDMVIAGRPYEKGPANFIYELSVSHKFFETMELPLAAGRTFTADDRANTAKVGIINEAAVKKFFPDENPLGRRFGTGLDNSSEFEIVGVVRDAKYNSLRDSAPPTVYFLHVQRPWFLPGVTFEVRTQSDLQRTMPALREAVRQVDPNLPVIAMSTQLQAMEGRLAQEWIFARAYALFGGIGLLFASIGLFGLMSYNVTRRTSELGIRFALGAQRKQVLRMVMQESLMMIALGLSIGLIAALAAGRFVRALLFNLAATDPVTIGVATLVMIGVSAIAAYLPARRASRVDPIIALRYE